MLDLFQMMQPFFLGSGQNFLSQSMLQKTQRIPRLYWRSAHLAPYAPELNPVENVWNYLKMNSMANEALYDLETLKKTTRRHGRTIQHRQPLLRSLMKHTPLFLRLQ